MWLFKNFFHDMNAAEFQGKQFLIEGAKAS
jgi:hypothetical protein